MLDRRRPQGRWRSGAGWLAALATLALAAAPAPARAYGSYNSDVETGSGIALAVFGGVTFIPVTFVLANPPVTAQTIVGKALVMAGSLVAISFCIYYFTVDDPLWVPHALGWGIGGGLAIAGFATWLTDDTPVETVEAVVATDPAAAAGGGVDAAPSGVGTPVPGEAGGGAGQGAPPEPAEHPETGGTGAFGLAPLAFPGGGGLLLAAVW